MEQRPVSLLVVVAAAALAWSCDEAATDRPASGDPAPTERILALRDASPATVSAAFHALIESGSDAVPALVKGLSDRQVRFACAEILARLPRELGGPALFGELVRQLRSGTERDERFTSFVAGALAAYGEAALIPFWETVYAGEPDEGSPLARNAAWALEHAFREAGAAGFRALLPGEERLEALLEAGHSDLEVRLAWVELLSRLPATHAGAPLIVDLVHELQRGPDRDERLVLPLVEALAHLDEPRAIPIFRAMLQLEQDGDPLLATSVAAALERILAE